MEADVASLLFSAIDNGLFRCEQLMQIRAAGCSFLSPCHRTFVPAGCATECPPEYIAVFTREAKQHGTNDAAEDRTVLQRIVSLH